MDPILLRGLERLLAVLIGGLTIYLGYRLFLAMPAQGEAEGKFELPGGISIYISRVGPAIFLSLFGSAVLSFVIYTPIDIVDPSGADIHWMSPSTDTEGEDTEHGRLAMRLELEFLNRLPALLREDLDEVERRNVSARVERLKLAVVRSAWSPALGSFGEFQAWWDEGAFDPVPAKLQEAVALYRAGSPDTP